MLLNYAHPLTPEQLRRVAELIGETPEVRTIPVQIDQRKPLIPQAVALADAANLHPEAWQTTRLVVNPPGLAAAASTLLAEIHGRCGYFPALLRLRPVEGALPPRFEVAEVIGLQAARDDARQRRET